MSLFPNEKFGEGDFGEPRQIGMLHEQFMHELNEGCGYCPFSRVPFDASFNDVPLYAVETFYVLVDDQRRKCALPQINADGEEEVRTLFVTGLPRDVQRREFWNLFNHISEYEGVTITQPSDQDSQPVAFVSFSNAEVAREVRDRYDGYHLDPKSHLRLKVQLAKSNTRKKDLFHPHDAPIRDHSFIALSHSPSSFSMGAPQLGNASSPPFAAPLSPMSPMMPAPFYDYEAHYPPMGHSMMPALLPQVFSLFISNLKRGLPVELVEQALSVFPNIARVSHCHMDNWACVQSPDFNAIQLLGKTVEGKMVINNLEIGAYPGIRVHETDRV